MKVEFSDHNLKVPYLADDLLSRKCHKLERMLRRFPTESLSLKCELNLATVSSIENYGWEGEGNCGLKGISFLLISSTSANDRVLWMSGE